MYEGTMTFEIGHLTLQPRPPVSQPVRARPPVEPPPAPVSATSLDVLYDVIPASPPPEVLAEVDAAWERAEQLAADNRELHFKTDESSGRVIIEVRSLDGEIVRTIPPSNALDVMSGSPL